MLNWDLAYDYAAIYLLLIIIIWYFMKKNTACESPDIFSGTCRSLCFNGTGDRQHEAGTDVRHGRKCWILGNKHLAASGAECDSAAVCVLCVTDRTYQCKADAACQMDAGIVWRG